MKKLIMSLLALSGVSYLACSQVDKKLVKYEEMKESAAYQELARVLYECGLYPDLVREIADELAITEIDTSNRIFRNGCATINYAQQDGHICFGGDTICDLDGLGIENSQKLAPVCLGSGVDRAHLLHGRLVILDAHGEGVHDLSQNVTCMQSLTCGLVAAGYELGKIILFDPVTGKQIKVILVGASVRSLAEMPDGHLVSGHDNGSIRVWSLESGSCVQQFPAHGQGIIYLTTIPGGYLLALGRDYIATIWKLKKRLHVKESELSSAPESELVSTASSSSSSSSSSIESEVAPVPSGGVQRLSTLELIERVLEYADINVNN
jgi:hypothetical protein